MYSILLIFLKGEFVIFIIWSFWLDGILFLCAKQKRDVKRPAWGNEESKTHKYIQNLGLVILVMLKKIKVDSSLLLLSS